MRASSLVGRRTARRAAATLLSLACGAPPGASREATVVYASGADLQSINPLVTVHPLAKAVQKHVLFLTLAAYDSAMRPAPRLASWTWSEARTSLTFRIRPDVRWHDGTPTTAADVEWTLRMARSPAVAYPRARDLVPVVDIAVLDSLTVLVRFDRPQPTFPDVFTDLAILPAHRLEGIEPNGIRTAPFNVEPLGNGPFAFVEYRPNQRWVFRRWDGFPESLGRPGLDRFVVAVVDEPATKLAALTSGELDFAGISPAHADFVRDDPVLRVIDYPVMLAAAIVWNLRRPPFDDRRVRRALTMALDRELIVDAYLYGFGVVADGAVPPEHPWHEEVPAVPFDVETARRLLDQAGWRRSASGVRERGGKPFAFALTTVGSGDNALEQMIQAQLRAVGADVRIRQLELTTFLSVAQGEARDFDALVTLIPGDRSLGHLDAMFGRAAGPLAYSGYASPRLEAALEAARHAATDDALAAAWRDAQRILAEDGPTTWLYHARGLQGATARLAAVRVDLRGELATIADWRP